MLIAARHFLFSHHQNFFWLPGKKQKRAAYILQGYAVQIGLILHWRDWMESSVSRETREELENANWQEIWPRLLKYAEAKVWNAKRLGLRNHDPRDLVQEAGFEIMIHEIWFRKRSHWLSVPGKTGGSDAGIKGNIQRCWIFSWA
jgi:hypothetical protein